MSFTTAQFRRRRGFTLVELVASMTVIATLAAVSSGLIYSATRAYRDISVRSRLHASASLALTRIFTHLRAVPLTQAAPTIIPSIDSVGASTIAWAGDCSLSVSGTNLMLVVDGGAPYVLLGGVTAFSVSTFDESNSTLSASLTGAACAAVRRVRISVTVEASGISETVSSRVFLRSAMSGGGV